MNLTDYQQEVSRTVATTDFNETIAMTAMGLAGESGEIVDTIKKYLFHGHLLNRDEIVKECGDVLWYLSALCNALGVPLDDVIEVNVSKLRKRYPDGFESKRSIEREEEV